MKQVIHYRIRDRVVAARTKAYYDGEHPTWHIAGCNYKIYKRSECTFDHKKVTCKNCKRLTLFPR